MFHRKDRQQIAFFILRIMLGSTFFAHGAQKVFGWFGGPGLAGFVKWTSSMGVPVVFGYLAAFAEFLGGCLMLLGIATELGALIVIPVMLGAVFLVHWNKGYFVQNGGFEYPFNLILALIALILGGPGTCALWDCCNVWRKK